MKVRLIFFVLILFSTPLFTQTNKIGLGGFFGNGVALSINYSHSFTSNIFLRPNISLSLSGKEKENYSFITYEIDLGYQFSHPKVYLYFAISGSYNNFISQDRRGNDYWFEDIPPHWFGKLEKEDCFGVAGKIGINTISNNCFNLGFEAKYLILFPNIRYHAGYSDGLIINRKENRSTIMVGVILGFML